MTHIYLPYQPLLLLNVPEVTPEKFSTPTVHVLNTGVTESNLTKFIQDVQKWLPSTLLKSKLRSYQYISERQWRSSSNCGQIAAKIARFNSVDSQIIARKFTKFVHDLAWLLLLNPLKAAWQSANSLSNARAKSKGLSAQRLRTSSKFNYLP